MLASRHQNSRRSDFDNVYAEIVRDAPARLRRERLQAELQPSFLERMLMPVLSGAALSFCIFAVVTSLNDPDYYSQKLITSLMSADVDPIRTSSASLYSGNSLPVPQIVRNKPLTPGDYQIVMIFDGEAIVSTEEELMRVKIGSVLPGLGEVKTIIANGTGGTIDAEFATLKTVSSDFAAR